MNKRWVFAYSLVVYALFNAAFVYFIGFLGNFLVPKSIDTGTSMGLVPALAVNLTLIALFGVQHSVMARQGFKRWWTQFVPEPIERSTYVLTSTAALCLIFWLWQPMTVPIWHFEQPSIRMPLWTLFGAGWLITLIAVQLINQFELLGLQQAWAYLKGVPLPPPEFKAPLFYRYIRHPIQSGQFIALWATPEMSLGHMVFAAAMSAYILIGIRYEERDLARTFGETYERYRRRVPALVPVPGRSWPS